MFIFAIVRRPVIALTAAGAVFVVTAGAVFAATAAGGHVRAATPATATTHVSHRVTTVGPPRMTAGPLRVIAVTPAPGSDGANGAGQVRVTFSGPLAPGSPMPWLSPPIPGRWAREAGTAVFTPATGFGPGTRVTVTVPTGRSGVRGHDGIPVAPTADGTFPVYERLRYQVMSGTNPDGSHYADPVEYVAYFNGGDAVHYFPRYSYGWPQSLGCVELPLDAAATAWPYLTYGSLVTVSP